MWYSKILTYIFLLASMLSSCELFGGHDTSIEGGEVVWKVENQEIQTVGTQPYIEENSVYFIQDAYLKAYTLKEGNRLWSKQLVQRGEGDYSHNIIQSNNVIFIDLGFRIKAFNKSNGALIWNTEITDNAKEISGIGSPIMSQDEEYLYAGRKGYVLKVRKSDGQIIRRYPLDQLVPEGVTQGSTEPIISPFGDEILYIPTNYYNSNANNPVPKGNVLSYNAKSGQYLWGTELENRYHVYTLSNGRKDSSLIRSSIYDAALTENYIVVLAGSSVVALDRLTGEEAWETFFSGEKVDGFDVGMAIKADGIYIASAGWHATKLDLKTGKVLWRKNIGYSNTSIPTVKNGRMYFNNSGGGGIWVLNTMDGSVIYNEPPPNHSNDSYDVYISSLGVGEGYMVNVGSKAVYCLKVPK